MNLQALYLKTKSEFAAAQLDNPGLEARWLLTHALGITDIDFISQPDKTVSKRCQSIVAGWMRRRIAGESLSRIIGKREFWGMPFIVSPDVLDPRADSETLVQAALGIFGNNHPASMLDLGTGSGCLIIALLREWPQTRGQAVDLSIKALDIARLNAAENEVIQRLELLQGHWFDPVNPEKRFDLIISNPPYIPGGVIANLDKNVRNYDPILALDGGIDGLDSYRIIISGLKKHLSLTGTALFEIGFGQCDDLARLAENSGFAVRSVYMDLAGIPRVVEISHGDK